MVLAAPSNQQHALSASIAAAEGLVSARTKTSKLSFALAIDGMAMEWCITQYLAAYVALFKRCDTTVSYRSTPLQKAMAVKMAKKSLAATCLAVGDGANDVSMIQESDVGVGLMGKEGSHAAMSADYVVLRFKHLLRLIFVHGRYSFYRTAKVCLFSFYKNTAFPTPTWYFQFYCLGTGQAFFDPFLMVFIRSLAVAICLCLMLLL
jgi:magnesium-transporting ATPase (P-type)